MDGGERFGLVVLVVHADSVAGLRPNRLDHQ
jgi:hypothetical protein